MAEAQTADQRHATRFLCSVPARLRLDRTVVEGEISDVSVGGFKFLPARPGKLPRTLAQVELTAGPMRLFANLAWLQPNGKALGCTFTTPIRESDVHALIKLGRLPVGL